MKATVQDISVRAGFELSFSDVLLMYEMCRFEVAHRNVSGWCGVFSQENLKVKSNIFNIEIPKIHFRVVYQKSQQVMEYDQDLENWYKHGYGDPSNRMVACPVVEKIVDTFEAVIAGQPSTKGTFYFSHSSAVMPLITSLGLFKDNFTLTADSFESQEADRRKYFSSTVTPFAGNVGFVLQRCQNDVGYRVAMFHNEVLKPLPLCPGHCSWSRFKDAYSDLIECPSNGICNSSP